jgi:hypothetical protein
MRERARHHDGEGYHLKCFLPEQVGGLVSKMFCGRLDEDRCHGPDSEPVASTLHCLNLATSISCTVDKQ